MNMFKTMLLRVFVVGIVLGVGSAKVYAQNKDLNKEVNVVGVYDPIITDADKLLLPTTADEQLLNVKEKYTYSVSQKDIKSSFALKPIAAAKISTQTYEDPQWFYARLGLGFPLQPVADLYINNLKPDDLSVGLFYNHRSIWSSIKNDNGPSIPIDEMKHGGGVYLMKYFDNLSLGIKAGLNQHQVLFYGYDTEIHSLGQLPNFKFNKDSLQQTYTGFYVKAGLESNNKDKNSFRYALNLIADIYGDNGKSKFDIDRMFAMKENTFGGVLNLGKKMGSHDIQLDGNINMYVRNLYFNPMYNSFRATDRALFGWLYQSLFHQGAGVDTANNRMIFNVHPSYNFETGKFLINAGVKFTGYKAKENMEARVFPMLNVLFRAADEFIPYARMGGGIDMNDYQSIASENPFITPGINMIMKPTQRTLEVQGGFMGSISKMFSYNLYTKYSLMKDYYFFGENDQVLIDTTTGALNFSLNNNFDPYFDDVQVWKVGAELLFSYRAVESILSMNYYYYSMDKLALPLHRPQITFNFNTKVNVSRSVRLGLDIHGQGKSPYLYSYVDNTGYYNKAFVDLGLNGEYIFNRNVSVFFQLQNVLNQNYEMWHLYKVPGIGVLGGITFKF